MRLKGISWIEQHFEKVFAAIFGVAALGVLTWQFAGKTNVVSVGPKKDVPLELAYEEVRQAAIRTRDAVTSTTVEAPTLAVGDDPISQFEKNYRGPVAPGKELAIEVGTPAGVAAGAGPKLGTGSVAELAELVIPAPKGVMAAAGMYTIDPAEAADPEVAKLLPPAPPLDKAAVTVEAMFDGKALKALLEADPDGATGPKLAMRRDWWESMQLLAFAIEREELLPDGKWGKASRVPAMPGRNLLLAEIDAGVQNAELLNSLRLDAAEHAADIRRPAFYDLFMGEWTSPSDQRLAEEASNAGGDSRAGKLSQKKSLERELEARQRKRDEMGPLVGKPDANQPPPAERSPGRGGAGGGGGGRRPGAGGGRPGGGGQRQPPSTPVRTYSDGERLALDRKIDELTKRIAQINKDLGLIADPAASSAVKEPALFESADIHLWAHDFNVERGKKYRYRGICLFNNPLYGKGQFVRPDQAEWARQTIAASQPSEWTEPVEVPAESYWFVTSASEPGGALGRGADARAEVFVFSVGYWRRGSTSLEPGDRVQAEIAVPDVTKMAMHEQPKPGDAGQPVPPADGGGAGGGRKRGPVPGGGGGGATPAGGPGATPAGGPGSPPPGGRPDAPPEKIPTVTRLVSVDATMLGVSSVVLASDAGGAAGRATQAYFRTGGGIEIRRPESERNVSAYRMFSQSAQAGLRVERPAEPERDRQPAPDRDSAPPPPPPPGGGGGGGGGGG